MTDPQTAANAAERVQAALDSTWPNPRSMDPNDVRMLLVERHEFLEDRKRMAAELERRGQLLGIGIDHEQWDAIAEAEGRRYEGVQTDDTIVGYLAYSREKARITRDAQRARAERLAAELEQVRRGTTLPVLRQAWRNGWSDRARAVRDAVGTSDNERDAYERAFARYMSEDPAEADKDLYRPIDGPDDPAAMPTRPAGGKRTPEQWCAEYGIDIADPDGWRNAGDPAWDEPITLPDFLRRAARSTCRGLTPDVWNRLSREAHEAADAERSDVEDTTAASARPVDGLGGTGEGQRTGTPAQGPQRGPQGDAVCSARVHPDFANGRDIRCTLPDGHQFHRNGTREWTP